MKKTFVLGLIAAALVFTACSNDDDFSAGNSQKKGMVLRATAEQPTSSRATFTDGDVWNFAFAANDQISVTNTAISTYYSFAYDGTDFKCEDATATESDATWYAYFPSNEISLTGQSGTKADVANKYALVGSATTTGKDGLDITMKPQVAILVINNQIGSIDINVKNSATTWVSGLEANADGFTVTTSNEQQNILSVTENGTYYVAVPAGVQISVKDGDDVVKTTGENGLTAGKYYNVTIIGRGVATATIDGVDTEVKWVQLWENGPKFAEYNVGATSKGELGTGLEGEDVVKTGANYVWGANWRTPSAEDMQELCRAGFGSDNIVVEYVDIDGAYGFNFRGKAEGYDNNTVFFPGWDWCSSDDGWADYVTSTQNSECAPGEYVILCLQYWPWRWDFHLSNVGPGAPVRPVLAE